MIVLHVHSTTAEQWKIGNAHRKHETLPSKTSQTLFFLYLKSRAERYKDQFTSGKLTRDLFHTEALTSNPTEH